MSFVPCAVDLVGELEGLTVAFFCSFQGTANSMQRSELVEYLGRTALVANAAEMFSAFF